MFYKSCICIFVITAMKMKIIVQSKMKLVFRSLLDQIISSLRNLPKSEQGHNGVMNVEGQRKYK